MKNNYPYQGKNLFQNPEYYFYAKCLDEKYDEEWKNYRLKKLNLFKNNKTNLIKNILPENLKKNTLLYYLRSVEISMKKNHLSISKRKILEAFIRKFEVHRRLFSHYDNNLKRLKSSKVASLSEYVAFARVLSKCVQFENGLYYLSTLIKLLDCILSIPEENFTKIDSKTICECIRIELQSVEKLYE